MHAGGQVIRRGDAILLQEFQPSLIGFGFHKLPPEMRRHARRVLPLLDASKQIAVMVVQRKKSLVLWMWAVWLGLRTREERRSGTGFDLCQIARNGAFNVFFRKRRVFALRIHETLLPAQSETETVAVVDLVALMLHEQEEVAEIVRVGNRFAQVCFQHGTERRLTFGLTEPFNVADRFGGLALHNDRQSMLPAELIRNCANLLVVAFGVAVVFSPGHLIYRIENHVRMNVLFIHMNANDDLIIRKVFLCKCLCNFQCQFWRDLTGLE